MDATVPTLPPYEPPKERVPAVLPPALATTPKPHGIINKMIGRMLSKKLVTLKSKSAKAIPKQKKKKVI